MKNEEFLSKKRAIELWDKNIIKTFMWGLLKGYKKFTSIYFKMFLNLLERLEQLISPREILDLDKQSYLSAMERSPVNSLEIKTLLKEALTENIDCNNLIIMKI